MYELRNYGFHTNSDYLKTVFSAFFYILEFEKKLKKSEFRVVHTKEKSVSLV